jgi:hypothetical protein
MPKYLGKVRLAHYRRGAESSSTMDLNKLQGKSVSHRYRENLVDAKTSLLGKWGNFSFAPQAVAA